MRLIYGAGIAGLLAAQHFQTAKIYEAAGEGVINHKSLLRFRSSAVGDSVGIPFKKVVVHKGVYHDSKFIAPNIKHANWYSKKVIGRLVDRSIWNVAASERYIAPENFVEQLIERCAGRIEWNRPVGAEEFISETAQRISTIPMSVVTSFVDKHVDTEFCYASTTVQRWRVPGADVYQTIYFTDTNMNLYRASITKDLLIAEYAGEIDPKGWFEHYMLGAFGLSRKNVEPIETSTQQFGKIAVIDNNWRKKFIFDLTTNFNVYSVGRFAIWKNILLDDVLQDIQVVKSLLNTSSYDRHLVNTK